MTTLLQQIADPSNLDLAFKRLDTKKPAGSDGMTHAQFAEDAVAKLKRLSEALLAETYAPKSLLRAKVPTGAGTRSVGLASVVDRIAQGAVLRVIAPTIEASFHEASCARTGAGARAAADVVLMSLAVHQPHTVVAADVSAGLGRVKHDDLITTLDDHIGDPQVMSLLCKFVAPRVDDGTTEVDRTIGIEPGTPVSMLFTNVVLHHVFDLVIEDKLDGEAGGYPWTRHGADIFVGISGDNARHDALFEALGMPMKDAGLTFDVDSSKVIRFGPKAAKPLMPGTPPEPAFAFGQTRFGHGLLPSGKWTPLRLPKATR